MARTMLLALAAALALGSAASGAPDRPADDVARDAARKPAEMVSFAGIKPGDKVVDLIPGGGYFTRVFSAAVGPTGVVYAVAPAATSPDAQPAAAKIAAEPGYENVKAMTLGAEGLKTPEPVDVLFTAQNYHDFHLKRLNLNIANTNKGLFDAVKPGGVLVIVDHTALDGAPVETADTLHRIDPAIVKTEVEAAGFKLEAQSDVLRNPADPKTGNVFAPDIRGKTDQFVMRFRKPK